MILPGLTFWLLLIGPVAASGCVKLTSDQIRIADLAAVDPAFRAADPNAVIGNAPAPGAVRVFRQSELAHIAARFHVSGVSAQDGCFEREAHRLTQAEAEAAIRKSVRDDTVSIEIIDMSNYPVPEGTLEFPSSALVWPVSSKPGAPVLWRGRIVVAPNRSAPVWVRARVSVRARAVLARAPARPDRNLTADDVSIEDIEVRPFEARPLCSLEDAVGRRVRRPLAAGQPLYAKDLIQPRQVERGNTIRVEIQSGAAALVFDGKAEAAGNIGDKIVVKMPGNGRRLSATIVTPDRVVVDAGPPGEGKRGPK